jgi:hypothetical protein
MGVLNKKLEDARISTSIGRKKGYHWKACRGSRLIDAAEILTTMKRNAVAAIRTNLRAFRGVDSQL